MHELELLVEAQEAKMSVRWSEGELAALRYEDCVEAMALVEGEEDEVDLD